MPDSDLVPRDLAIARFPSGASVESLLTDSRGRTYVLFTNRGPSQTPPRQRRRPHAAHPLEAMLLYAAGAAVLFGVLWFATNV